MNAETLESMLFPMWTIVRSRDTSEMAEFLSSGPLEGPTLIVCDELVSTSDSVASLLSQVEVPLNEPWVVLALKQTGGHGRMHRPWHMRSGASLAFTLVDRTPPGLSHPGQIALAAAVGISKALEPWITTDDRLDIKWPNDVLIADRKVGGILIGSVCSGERGADMIGVGLNIGPLQFPPELRESATTLARHAATAPCLEEVLGEVLRALLHERRILMDDSDSVVSEFARRSSWVSGKKIRFEKEGRSWVGVTDGLDESGALWCRQDNGERIRLNVSEIHDVRG